MEEKIEINAVFNPSEDVVAREVQGEFIIIPITSGISDVDTQDVLFTLNETGKAVWNKLDGKKSLKTVVEELSLGFEAPEEKIKEDVLGLTEELLKRKMVVKI